MKVLVICCLLLAVSEFAKISEEFGEERNVKCQLLSVGGGVLLARIDGYAM